MSTLRTGYPYLLTIKCGRYEYVITERDLFMDNGACVQLLSQRGPWSNWSYTTPILSKREIKRIGKFHHVQRPHSYGASVKVFSLQNNVEAK